MSVSQIFLLNIKGLKKRKINLRIVRLPLFSNLIKAGSVSKFKRSLFYRQNFNSMTQLFTEINNTLLKYDFRYWLSQYYPKINVKKHYTLIDSLQYHRHSGKPLRLIIRKNLNQDISEILNLFAVWCQSFSDENLNYMFVSESCRSSGKQKEFFLENSEPLKSFSYSYEKTNLPCLLRSVNKKSKMWFMQYRHPNHCRGLSFSFLLLSDMHKWENPKKEEGSNILSAVYPGVPENSQSVIILEGGPSKRNSLFNIEWKAAINNLSPFIPISLPWYENPACSVPFDIPEDKEKFRNLIIKNRNRKHFPWFPGVSGRYLFSLLQRKIPLQSIYWYASESAFYKYPRHFQHHYSPL